MRESPTSAGPPYARSPIASNRSNRPKARPNLPLSDYLPSLYQEHGYDLEYQNDYQCKKKTEICFEALAQHLLRHSHKTTILS
jgi:hypothetical protein